MHSVSTGPYTLPHEQRALAWIALHCEVPAEWPPEDRREERRSIREDIRERYISIGRSAEDAVKTAYNQGRTVLDLSNIEDGEPIPWTVITADLRKACITEFHQTPYGTVLLNMR
ncbi:MULTISPECIES: hypothetical protein [Streptomyces]|uniref:hypothetical protein n=1 Tax=Streptomyces TaxID=1883 RepID=UPI003088D6B6|nr:hypothetical protein OHA60_10305 [Streptomyces cellulosae]